MDRFIRGRLAAGDLVEVAAPAAPAASPPQLEHVERPTRNASELDLAGGHKKKER